MAIVYCKVTEACACMCVLCVRGYFWIFIDRCSQSSCDSLHPLWIP